MKREKALEQIIMKYLPERYEKSKESIKEYYHENAGKICEELERNICHGILECEKLGKRINHIVVSILYSSSLTKSYELQIAFLDNRIYLDDVPVYEYWAPEFIFKNIEDDLQFLKKMASADMPRIKEYEMEPIRFKYVHNHYFMVLLLIKQVIPGIIEKLFIQHDIMENKIMVSFGRYMEKGVLLYQGEDVNEVLYY